MKSLGGRGGRLLRLTAQGVTLLFVAGGWWMLPAVPRLTWTTDTEPLQLVLSVDGRAVGVAHPHGLSVWDVETGAQRAVLHLPSAPNVRQRGVGIELLSANGQVVVFRDEGGARLRLWNSAAKQDPVELNLHTVVKASADGAVLVIKGPPAWPVPSLTSAVQTWEPATG